MAELKFWYEFASPYAYFSMMRIEALTKGKGIEVIYQPFLLGPLFQDVGWRTSPFLIYENKGKNFFRDIEREAQFYDLPPIKILSQFPENGLIAARTALIGLKEGWGVEFSKAVYKRQFQQGLSIKELEDVAAIITHLAIGDADVILEKAQGTENKAKLRTVGEDAKRAGIFGAPSFEVGDELFWGNDRLERAVAYSESSELKNMMIGV